jgi:beta-galactosidase
MKPWTTFAALLFCFDSQLFARETASFDADWRFFQGEAKNAESSDFNDSGWTTLSVPHDWSITGNFSQSAPTGGAGGWLPSGVAWYRKAFTLQKPKDGKRVWIEFDGVMANSDVWLNGKLLGHRPSGYNSFNYDLTEALADNGKNILVVKADTSAQPASRWYTGAGIYRHVRLVSTHPAHVVPWGVHVTTDALNASGATVKVTTTLTNSAAKSGAISLSQTLLGPDQRSLGQTSTNVNLAAGKEQDSEQSLQISSPPLWSLDSPQMCTLVTRVMAGTLVLDEVRTPVGIRRAEFDSNKGFVLNGKSIKLKGVCLHHDGGAVGAAVPLAVWERRLQELKKIGVNAIRTSHNPVAPEFLDLCDRMGFAVMDEFFDCWTKGKNPADYHLYFKEWFKTDLREGILRDRNHPSVILYSVGNEIHDTPDEKLAKSILKDLVETAHAADSAIPVTQALFRPNVSHDYDNGLADMLDVIGTNYRDQELLDAWKKKPTRKIINTEQIHDRKAWLISRDNPQHAGQFLWTGIDYIGESKTWPITTYNSGLLDRAGFMTPRGYERQSWWSEQLMVKVGRRLGKDDKAPTDPGYETVAWERKQVIFFDWNPTETAAHDENVEVYSNADEVELFLNGKSLGKQRTKTDCTPLNWKVPYEAGSLRAVAYNKGKEVAKDELRTAGKPSKITLSTDRESLTRSFDDVAHVIVTITDDQGITIPTASDTLTFSVTGAGKFIAADNASIVSTESFVDDKHAAYQGRCLALIRAADQTGTATLKVSAPGLKEAEVSFTVK